MTKPGDHPEAAVVVSFLQEYLQDRTAGSAKDLTDYQRRYPGFEDAIAREFERMRHRGGEEPPLTEPPPEHPTEELESALDPEISVGDPGSEVLTALQQRRQRADRYRSATALGRGGMGEVLRVWDPDIRRAVAMKVLIADTIEDPDGSRRPEPQALSRFLDEAQITGQLDHPGIVPVHELGLDEDGRVYFTMSLIRGHNLRQIIDLVHGGDAEWTRTRTLGVLLRVCEAMAFAHDKGVVHRDLKPGNIMVGRFGETYVVDWGLARVLSREDRRDIRLRVEGEPLSSVRSMRRDLAEDAPDSPLVTMDGDVVGTPAYMAPEQAQGMVEEVGRSADVYAVGAMLYHLLTGQMPYVPKGARLSSRTVLARVVDGPPRPVQELAADVPAELVAICEKAMAREVADRYPDTLELASDLRAFLETRVVQAYRTGPIVEASKWVRRNRFAAAAGVAAALALAVGLVFALVGEGRANQQAARAQANFELAFTAGEDLLAEVGLRDLRMTPGADPIRRAVAEKALPHFHRMLALRGDDPRVRQKLADIHLKLAVLHRELGDPEDALEHLGEAGQRYEELLAEDPGSPILRVERASVRNQRGLVLWQQGRYDDGIALLQDGVTRLRELWEGTPDDAAFKNVYLARYGSALTLLGNCLHDRGEPEAALEYRREAARVCEQLVAAFPGRAREVEALGNVRGNLGLTLWMLGRKPEAAAEFEEAIAAVTAGLERHPGHRDLRYSLGNSWNRLGVARRSSDDAAGAGEAFARAIDILRELTVEYPGVRDYHGELGGTLCNGSAVPAEAGDLERAQELADEAIAQVKIALTEDPTHAAYRSYLRNSYRRASSFHLAAGRHQRGEELAEGLVADLGGIAASWAEAARWLCQCAATASADAGLDEAERSRVTERYGGRSVEMLRQAAAMGHRQFGGFADGVYDPVRERADFRELVAELGDRGGGR